MPLELLPEPDWLARRKLSASRIAAVYTERLGLLTLWAILTGKEKEEFPELLGDFGLAVEPVSRKWFYLRTGKGTVESLPVGQYWLLRGDGPLTASPDTLVLRSGISASPTTFAVEDLWGHAEHKTCDRVAAYKWNDGPDRYAWVQTQATFAAAREAGLNWTGAYATVLIGNGYDAERDFRAYEVEPDEDFIGEVLEWAFRFQRDHVEADIPPPPDGLEATLRTLRLLFPARLKSEERRVGVLGMGAWDYYREMKRLDRIIDDASRQRDRQRQELELMVAEAGLEEASLPATEERPNPPRFLRLSGPRAGYAVAPKDSVTTFQELKR